MGKGGRSGGQIRAGEDQTTPSPRPKTRPKLYAEREKGSLPGQRRSLLYSLFCVATSIYAATSGCLYRVPGRAATKVRIM
jgi:hypothetical protein